MGASASMSTADNIAQQNTMITYSVVIFVLVVLIMLYNYPDFNIVFGLLALVSFIYYVYSRNWRYVLR